eukprot:14683857-Heterocapsa_arctica.AAC.1
MQMLRRRPRGMAAENQNLPSEIQARLASLIRTDTSIEVAPSRANKDPRCSATHTNGVCLA